RRECGRALDCARPLGRFRMPTTTTIDRRTVLAVAVAALGYFVDLFDRGVPAVFVETSVPDRAVAALIESASLRGHPIRIGGALFSDAMGASGTAEERWDGMMLHNARTIVEALGGDASSIATALDAHPKATP
ncbi:MAG: metal ABC transporter solute-binding protein, Zn/Mn family, partial [Phycisphaerales bacterium]